jgi:divalent metal cation (Fe/Co/Zn/Cd) transporter
VTPVDVPTLPVAAPAQPASAEEHGRLVARARALAWLGVAWHGVEAAISVGAGLAAGSIALIGFGADSLIEAVAGFIVLWRFAGARATSERAERRAQQLIAISFCVIGLYVAVEAIRSLAVGHEPQVSWIGIGLSAFTLMTMPPLAVAKERVAEALGSSASKSESRQTMLCAYLSAALLVGLGANALLAWWWADPLAALMVAAVAFKEGRASWAGEACCTSPVVGDARRDGCCE